MIAPTPTEAEKVVAIRDRHAQATPATMECVVWHDMDTLLALIESQRATIERVERERDEARGDLEKLMDPELKHLRMESGGIDLALTGPIVQHMGLVICEHFRASGAENYIEMTYHAKTEPFETYVWTVHKRAGMNSPHDLRAKAERRAEAAEARVTALEAEKAGIAKGAERILELADGQAKFWRDHQRLAKEREDKTRFAVRAEPWENAAFALRQALSRSSTEVKNDD